MQNDQTQDATQKLWKNEIFHYHTSAASIDTISNLMNN